MITSALILMLGGALGAVARYQTTRIIARIHPSARFPLATLLINLTGSALLGALLGLLSSSPAELTQTPLYLLYGRCNTQLAELPLNFLPISSSNTSTSNP